MICLESDGQYICLKSWNVILGQLLCMMSCFFAAQTLTQSYFQSSPWQIRKRSSGHVNTLSWLKLTTLNRCYGWLAGSYLRNCIIVAHKTSCCLLYHVAGSNFWLLLVSNKIQGNITRLRLYSHATSFVSLYLGNCNIRMQRWTEGHF